ncbi:uncharacterized protein PITG_03912 [Phytophthora infestans T30-4]|uniref:Glycoside hydrolase n=1 Tax=Phytophthora infestans (strain T30-4) TaxID=403677 RepID=D0MYV0_PHYIT|nr:uncharacterized protein PITG_03912 [Phytophthora infestans T30-4]EEY66348.1 conserved hypothetical protein [Phytophthora infestans T30-4]|eukprot:XP_002906947.1 conserved hypothetical protein [Phytophthora infestans T30-4]
MKSDGYGDARQAVFAGDFLNFTILKDYAELILTEFGQKVKFWSTINEPLSYMYIFYIFAVTDSDEYEAALNLLLAHAEMVALFRNLQNQGSVPLRIRYSYDATVPSVVPSTYLNRTACTAAKWYANSATTGCFETEPEDKKRLKYLTAGLHPRENNLSPQSGLRFHRHSSKWKEESPEEFVVRFK